MPRGKGKKKKNEPPPQNATKVGMTTPLKECETCQTTLFDDDNWKALDNFDILEATKEKEKITEFGRVARIVYEAGCVKVKHAKCGVVLNLMSGERVWDTTKEVFLKWAIYSVGYENRDEILVKLYEQQEVKKKEEERQEKTKVEAVKKAEEETKKAELRKKEVEFDKARGNYAGEDSGWSERERKMFQ